MGRLIAHHSIADIRDISLTSVGPQAMQLLNDMGKSSRHYPEMIVSTDILNCSSIGVMVYNVVKPFLPEQTIAKLKLFGTDYQDKLHAQYDLEDLPKSLGGHCNDYENCRTHVAAQRRDVSVSAGQVWSSFPFDVEVGDSVKVSVDVSEYDILLKMYFKHENGAEDEQGTLVRDELCTKIQFSWKAEMKGVLMCSLSNEHSRWRSKNIRFKIHLDF